MNSPARYIVPLCLVLCVSASASSNLDLARQLNQAFIEVAEKVSPCVVVITVTPKPGAESLDSLDDSADGMTPREFWRKFHQQFEDPKMEKLIEQGSGVIIRANGYILTNRHVVEDAETIEVRLQDGRTFKATVRGMDAQSDVAVIKIEASGLPVAKFGNSARTRVGEFAIAIGAPFSLDYSVTFGHVSAKGRSNIVPSYFGGGMLDQDFLQTDANINPGNSGGPLVNIEGEIIGINTLIRGLRTGIGFAIPSDLAREVSEQLIAGGKFARPWLGVSILGLKEDPDHREQIKGVDDGVLVRGIVPNGPAAASDLRTGDVITKVDGRRVASTQELRNQVRGKKIGEPVTLEVFRESKTIRVSVKPGEYVEAKPVLLARKKSRGIQTADLGLEVQWLTADEAKKLGVKLADGVVVTAVKPSGLAAQRGIKTGDIITSVNQERTASPAQFREALQGADLKKGVLLELTSGEARRSETLKAAAE
jgi:serine protease Do